MRDGTEDLRVLRIVGWAAVELVQRRANMCEKLHSPMALRKLLRLPGHDGVLNRNRLSFGSGFSPGH